jgi:hypothetical protein
MTNPQKQPFDWAFFFQWLVATTMGWVLGQVLFPELALIVTGLAIGILQWLVLVQHFSKAWRWLAATVIGWTIAGIVVLVALPIELEFFTGPLFGAGAGIAQWLILRREVCWSGWWIVVSALAWTVGLSVLPGIILTGIMVGVLTGMVLELLLRFPKPQTQR